MHRPIDTHDHIAIAQIVIYTPFLVAASFLGFKHGFGKSSGWYFLIALSLARIIGGAFRLASISDATNIDLYVGWLVLNNLGLSPLILALFGLLGRVAAGINRGASAIFAQARYRRLVDMVMLVALILSIIGGTRSTYDIGGESSAPQVHYNQLAKVAVGLMIGGYVLLAVEALLHASQYRQIEGGERRILGAVFVALPFVLVRLIYSCLKVFNNSTSSTWEYLGMSVIMEIIAVAVCLAVGLTLRQVPKASKDASYEMANGPLSEGDAPHGYSYGPPHMGRS